MTLSNSIYAHSTNWQIRACSSETKYLNLMLSTKNQDVSFCAPLPTHTVGKQQDKSSMKSIDNYKQAVWICSDKQAYATQTDIKFMAVAEGLDPLYFFWRFGDGPEIKTTSRIFKKRYRLPDKYNVTVRVSDGVKSIRSDVYAVVIQRSVQPNRLLYSPSVLSNSSVKFTCRVSSGTDVSYVWNFGDGTKRNGSSTEHHVFYSTGEYIIQVIMSNLVSSTSLTGHIFVVEELCQPPPVKNMGPHKIQVWRSQPVHLAVTFEAQIECNVSRGLLYRWTIYDMSGQKLLLSHIDTGRQYIDLPKYLLHYGTFKAIAKVQVSGNVVYSNYSVLVEVVHRHPVSIISGATNIFINHRIGINVTLDGWKSHDPDYPNNTLSYSWSCRPVNTQKSSCFNRNIMSTAALLTFPALALKPEFDLLKFTLTVYSGNRSSSSEMFITVTSKHVRPKMPKVGPVGKSWPNVTFDFAHHPICEEDCQENSVNWNEPFSVSAFCEDCDCNTKNVTYRWKLHLVNASSRAAAEVPFCSTMDLGLPFRMEESLHFSRPAVTPNTPALLTETSIPGSLAPYLLSDLIDLTAPVTLDSLPLVKHPDVHNPHSNTNHHAVFPAVMHSQPGLLSSFPGETVLSEGHRESLSASDRVSVTDFMSEYDYYNFGIEEADPGIPVGRPTGSNSVGFSWNEGSFPDSFDNEGENLMDPNMLAVSEKTLLDLDKQLIHPSVFESYTLTGLSSSVVAFKPFMLKPKSLYLLEVFASCEQRLRGKSQLFFHTQAVPEGMNCQVQPNTGNEIHTHFSIFCSSGKEDLLYEYSYSLGNTKRKLLYEGRDFQHYFSLPSGDPNDDYKVNVYIEIKNRFGSATKPCPVTVTVFPSFQRNSSSQPNPDQELYLYGVGNLTSLRKTGSNRDIINYIFILTKVLNRLSLDRESSMEFLMLTRSALISAVCQLSITHKDISYEIIYRLSDLINITSQLTFYSVKQVIQHVHKISSVLNGSEPPADHVNALVSLLSGVLEAPVLFSKPGHQLINKALHTITDLILECMMSSNISQYNLSTTFMELLAWTDDESHSTVKTFGLTAFHFTDFLEMQFQHWRINSQQKPCVITWLTVYRQSPYRSSRDMQFSGETADVRLYNCTTRKEIKVRHLSTPVTVEFQRKDETKQSKHTDFTLMHSEVNIHEFNITSQILQRAIQITVHFTRPAERPFPILLLLRMYEQPTPDLYNKQTIYHWKGQTAHFFLPQSYVHATGTVYLMLLKADYNKSPSNKYITRAVNYTLRIESVECLSWDGEKQWKPDGCFPLAAVSPDRIYCSCNHLASFAVSHEAITNNFSSADVSQFIHSKLNYIPVILAVIFLALHIMVSVICRKADVSLQKTTGSFLLPENNPSDRFLYAVTIDTGFRSRTRMTAKVYIVLHGDDGVSQTREISSSDSRLFTNNSRNTFILSSPECLGRVWKVHLWHDNGGSSPSWYLSHVVVKDLVQGSCWFFLGQCWLAVDEGDGRVERNLVASECGLTFKQLLYMKLTEYLEDFHPWFSVYSRPSSSSHTHTQRLSVCLLLLQGYMCVNTLLINLLEKQGFAETGLIDVPAVCMLTGMCSALAVMPAGGLVSLVFRVSKTKSSSVSGEQYKVKVSALCSIEEHHDAFLMNDRASESCLSWNSVSCSWKKEYKEIKYLKQDSKTSDSVSASKLQDDLDTILEIVDDSISDVNKRLHGKCKWKKSDCKSHSSADVLENQQVCGGRIQSLQSWCCYLGWTLCMSLSLTCVTITSSLGAKFNKTETLLWAHSVFFSLICGGFVLHPAMILITAITVSLRHRKRSDWFHSLSVTEPLFEFLRHRGQKSDVFGSKCQSFTERSVHFEKVLADRQRARFLRLVRPPNSRDLKLVRGQIKKQTLFYKTTRMNAFKSVKGLLESGWMTPFTQIVILQFVLYNGPSNLFTSVTILVEQTSTGALMPSASVQSTRLYHFPAALDYSVMICEVTVIICSLLRYICSVYKLQLKTETIDFLKKEDFKLLVDLSSVFICEQSFYLAEFEDLMDELMFHLCTMSDNLPAKENLFEIQSNFSIPLSDVHDGSDSERLRNGDGRCKALLERE
ncbi:polycystic kidney disease 1 like 1 [Danio aesculapii]|uniref:polycystic kidney disease 1 like 1 n=1 Tax=Danio aesculapii TaxID=1142201 RepID=UPI0024BF690D|nr:polycystic kidney disease 1 like 1 [Danio aesculapii]